MTDQSQQKSQQERERPEGEEWRPTGRTIRPQIRLADEAEARRRIQPKARLADKGALTDRGAQIYAGKVVKWGQRVALSARGVGQHPPGGDGPPATTDIPDGIPNASKRLATVLLVFLREDVVEVADEEGKPRKLKAPAFITHLVTEEVLLEAAALIVGELRRWGVAGSGFEWLMGVAREAKKRGLPE